jgi:hypothetical protein
MRTDMSELDRLGMHLCICTAGINVAEKHQLKTAKLGHFKALGTFLSLVIGTVYQLMYWCTYP